jgi:hypothetical protein
LGATAISFIGALMGVRGSIVYSMGIGCMIIAILWHSRVLAASEAEGKRLREAAQRDKAP